MHVPSNVGFQFLAMGLQGKSARKKKVSPHNEHMTIMTQVMHRARRY